MKKIAFLLLSFLSISAYSQDYMDKIAQQTCDCLSKISDTVNVQKQYMELGVCMINAAQPYKKQLKKDHNINFDNIENEGAALGKVIGFKMATVCPDALVRLSNMDKEEDTSTKNKLISIGRVTQIDRENFVVFSVFDNSGKSMKFYWLTSAESNIDLANNYRTLIENNVKITYYAKEFFDPKIGEYRNFNVIEKIEKVSK